MNYELERVEAEEVLDSRAEEGRCCAYSASTPLSSARLGITGDFLILENSAKIDEDSGEYSRFKGRRVEVTYRRECVTGTVGDE